MGEYHLHAKTHSRGAGKGAGGHVRYILREGAYAQKTVEQVHGTVVEQIRVDRAEEIAYAESGDLPDWAQSPADYWDAADQYERANGTVYREIEFALPKELSPAENIALAQTFAKHLVDVPGGHTPYILAIHRSEKNPDLWHGHLMLSDKIHDGIVRDPALWFRRASNPGKDPARGGAPKTQLRISQTWLGEVVRPLWQKLANEALAHAGVDARIDHRSLEARRLEQEVLAAQAQATGNLVNMREHRRLADAFDRPPQPKKGRVLTHAGPEKAPGRAAMVVDFELAKAARKVAVEAIREEEAAAERNQQILAQAQALLSAAQMRQSLRKSSDEMRIRARWQKRQQMRVDRVLDAEALAETRDGFRAPLPAAGLQAAALQVAATEPGHQEHPSWAVYRERVLTDAYGQAVGQALGRWVRVDRDQGSRTLGRAPSLHIHNKVMDITDYGDRLVGLQAAPSLSGKTREIDILLKIAGAKGWKSLTVTGTEDFQMRAGAAALAAGFELMDHDLVARITAQQAKDAEAQRAKDLKAAPILAEWMRTHPKQAQAQRLAGGKVPLLCPEGLERSDLQRPALWDAAEVWAVGRYGKTADWQALAKDPDPLKAQAAAAGREAAYNAWAQGGLTLKIGQDAPTGPGITWTLSGEITRGTVERHAQWILARRNRAGVDHGVTVTFADDVSIPKKVLVLEHLLRQSVPVDAQALEKAGEGFTLNEAQARLSTHEPDGRQQAWYTRDLEQKAAQRKREEAARIRADRVKKLDGLVVHLEQHGSMHAVQYFEAAGFEKDKEGRYFYPDPDLPGVQKAWKALAAAQRKAYEADLQKRAEELGHRGEIALWTKEQRAADSAYQRIAQEITDDPSLQEMADTAYQQGINRAQQEREAQREQDRKALLKAAQELGHRAEKEDSDTAKQAESQREFAALVQRGAGLGVDEKALSESMQSGREAYHQEQARARNRGMGR